MKQPFQLAACAEMLWQDKPMDWRAKRLTELGLGVELWNWPDHDLNALEKSGANFTIMNGYLRGRLSDDEGAEELLSTAEALEVFRDVLLFEDFKPLPSPPLIKGGSFALVLKTARTSILGQTSDSKFAIFDYLTSAGNGTIKCPPLIRGGLGRGLTPLNQPPPVIQRNKTRKHSIC